MLLNHYTDDTTSESAVNLPFCKGQALTFASILFKKLQQYIISS